MGIYQAVIILRRFMHKDVLKEILYAKYFFNESSEHYHHLC